MILIAAAFAASADIDVALVRTGMGLGPAPGVGDNPGLGVGGWEAGLTLMEEHHSLVAWKEDVPRGAILRDRVSAYLEARVGVSSRVSLRLRVPFTWDVAGPDLPLPSSEGPGLADPALGAGVSIVSRPSVRAGAHVDMRIPVGGPDTWRAEDKFRLEPALTGGVDLGILHADAQVGLTLREQIETGAQVTAGNELASSATVSTDVWADRAWARATVVSRLALHSKPAGVNGVELLAGIGGVPFRGFRVELFAGRGLSSGYGASRFRVGVGVGVGRPPPPRRRAPTPMTSLDDVPEEVARIDGPTEPLLPTVVLARIEGQEIVVRDPVQFAFATAQILPVSAPTLEALATLLREHPDILALVIEGHASEEGSFAYNYDLANRRAIAIFEALVARGIAPERLSYRSMGEVVPTGTSDLAQDRRVVFRIVRRGTPPETPSPPVRPWEGR